MNQRYLNLLKQWFGEPQDIRETEDAMPDEVKDYDFSDIVGGGQTTLEQLAPQTPKMTLIVRAMGVADAYDPFIMVVYNGKSFCHETSIDYTPTLLGVLPRLGDEATTPPTGDYFEDGAVRKFRGFQLFYYIALEKLARSESVYALKEEEKDPTTAPLKCPGCGNTSLKNLRLAKDMACRVWFLLQADDDDGGSVKVALDPCREDTDNPLGYDNPQMYCEKCGEYFKGGQNLNAALVAADPSRHAPEQTSETERSNAI
jgi:hypothetical protein